MGVRLIVDVTANNDAVAMYCSTSGFAFGPVFDSQVEAEEFLDWFRTARREDAARALGVATRLTDRDHEDDPRAYDDHSLGKLVGAWKKQRNEVTV